MLDKRYQKTEEQILRLFFEYGDSITVENMARIIGVNRSTIYRHHKTTRGIIDDYTQILINKYENKFDKNIRRYYFSLLVFIMRHKKIFSVFLKMRDRRLLLMILRMNKDNLMKYAGFRKEHGKVFNIYCSEIVAIMKVWGENEFSKDDFDVVLNDVLFLTKNMKVRLGPLGHN